MNISHPNPFTKEHAFPSLPLEEWRDTKNTLHLYMQIVGKVRLALFPKMNHWWHVPMYVSPRGITTRAIPYGYGSFEIEFDLNFHALNITANDGSRRSFPLYDGLSVADFYRKLFGCLDELGIECTINRTPYEHPTSKIPFDEDNENSSYNRDYVNRFWRILVGVDAILEEFRGRFVGKSTPIHLFWHSFDMAVTRFSGRPAPAIQTMRRVDREAYSHEVISFGFWAGDDNVPAPAFYSYVYPEPPGLTEEPLTPARARWIESRGSSMALLMYDDIRKADSPRDIVLGFLESAYEAGARRAGWDVETFTLAETAEG